VSERRRLYKYRPIDLFTESIFRDNELRVTAAADLNDPFECRARLTFGEIALGDWEKVASRLVEIDPARSLEDARELALKLIADPARGSRGRGYPFTVRMIEESRQNVAFLCLTEVSNDILMWAHYADGHRGICLEFAPDRCSMLSQAMPVVYSNEIPTCEFFIGDVDKFAYTAVLTKSAHWSYEKEWRALETRQGSCNLPYAPEALTGVIFGTCCTEEDRAKVRGWAQPYRDLSFYEARLSETSYEVVLVRVEGGSNLGGG
jgi:hypothetical protein